MESSQSYFPEGLFGPRSDVLVKGLERDLSALHEGPLWERDDKPPLRVYRFTWIRAFHPVLVVAVRFGPHLPAVLRVSRLERDRLFPAFPKTNSRELDLSDEVTESLISIFRSVGFRGLTSFEQKHGVTLDGAVWLIEAAEPNFYHAVYRHSPKDGEIRSLGIKFLEIAGLLDEEIY